jgi:hypothetical protein
MTYENIKALLESKHHHTIVNAIKASNTEHYINISSIYNECIEKSGLDYTDIVCTYTVDYSSNSLSNTNLSHNSRQTYSSLFTKRIFRTYGM